MKNASKSSSRKVRRFNYSNVPSSSVRLPPQVVSEAAAREVIAVREAVLIRALGAIAAVIEEPYCIVGAAELRELVGVHGALCSAFGWSREYRMLEGAAVYVVDPQYVCKAPEASIGENSCLS